MSRKSKSLPISRLDQADSAGQRPVMDPKYLPKVEIRLKPEDIVIPSVSGFDSGDSPRSIDSGSTITFNSVAAANFGGVSPMRTGKNSPGVHGPLKRKGNNFIIEVGADMTDSPSPVKAPQPANASVQRQQVNREGILHLRGLLHVDSDVLFNDDLTISTDEPRHQSSGASLATRDRDGTLTLPEFRKGKRNMWGDASRGLHTVEMSTLEHYINEGVEDDSLYIEDPPPLQINGSHVMEGMMVSPIDKVTHAEHGDMDDESYLSVDSKGIVDNYRLLGANDEDDETEEQHAQAATSSQNSAAKKQRDANNLSLKNDTLGPTSLQPIKISDAEKFSVDIQSKARGKLADLSSFVRGHTTRKVMVAWTSIESRFQKSQHRKVEYVKDKNGLSHQIKYNALSLSALTGILCNTQVKCSYQDLPVLYEKFLVTPDDILKSRRLAALRVTLGPNNGAGLRQAQDLLDELHDLMLDEEPLVSQNELMECVFPADPKLRQKRMKELELDKANYIKMLLEEKQKKEEIQKRTEERLQKMISDFENTIKDIQFPKGPLSLTRLKAIKSLIKYSEKAFKDANAATEIQVPTELLTYIGVDAFPRVVREGIEREKEQMRKNREGRGSIVLQQKPLGITQPDSPPKATKEQLIAKLKEDEILRRQEKSGRIGYEGEFRIKLHQPHAVGHTVLSLIRTVVTYGKGLNGFAYRDVVELLQAYSATRIQARFRGHKRWWRYKGARAKWAVIFRGVKVSHFKSWALFIRHVYDTRNYCWRKMRAWHTYTKNAKKRREHFRINFWPFYTWHRWAASVRTGKEKAFFLAHRVFPTYRQLHVFRAWKRYYLNEKYFNETADNFWLTMKRFYARVNLSWWRRWTRRRIKLRFRWYKEGMISFKRKIFMRKLTPFLIWKMTWYYKKVMHSRISEFAPIFRTSFLKGAHIRRVPSNGTKKEIGRLKLKHLQEEAEERAKAKKDTKKKKKKRKKKGADGDDSVSESEAGDDLRVVTRRMMRLFKFTPMDKYQGGSIDPDDDDVTLDFTPPTATQSYSEVITAADRSVPGPLDVDFLDEADEFIVGKIMVLTKKYTVIDQWNLMEWSLRYHNFMHRAVTNLRNHAIINKNTRNSLYKRNHSLKKKCFAAFITWMTRDGGTATVDQSDAEKIYAEEKAYKVNKMMKWRDISLEIREKIDRGDDEIDINRDPDAPLTEHEKRVLRSKREAKAAARQAMIDAGIEPFNPPNFLDWDREERQEEENRAAKMLKISIAVKKHALAASLKAEQESRQYDENANNVAKALADVFKEEDDKTSGAIANQDKYVSKFKIHAADNMLTVLSKIYKQVQISLMKAETKKFFRSIRMPMMKRRADIMFNRKRLQNWIRICRRLNYLSQHALVYAKRRSQWVFLNRWLKLVETESTDASPGLVPIICRRTVLYGEFGAHLSKYGFVKTVYPNNKRLYRACANLAAVFKRWAMSVHEDKLFELMEEKMNRFYELRLLHRIFWSMKTLMTPEETFETRQLTIPYTMKRARCDLDQIAKRFISKKRCNVLVNISRLSRRFAFCQIKAAKKAPSFRRFLDFYKWFVNRRIIREQRILIDAFDTRGTQEYVDVCCPRLQDPPMPGLMRRLDGKTFCDPHPYDPQKLSPLRHPLPAGFKLSKLRVNHQEANGAIAASVTGWQVVWSGDGTDDVEGVKRGRWKGAAMKVHELVIPKNEFVVGIEYLYAGAVILGIRLKLFFSGFSRWLGGKPSLSTLSVYLGCDLAPEQEFESEYKVAGADEERNPAMPRSFIIGFTGVEVDFKVSGLGLCVRKVRDQHIFSYYWIDDAIQKKGLKGLRKAGVPSDQNAVDGKQRVDIESLPSVVDPNRYTFNKGQGNVSISESLTMESLPKIKGASAPEGGEGNDERSVGDLSSLDQPSVDYLADPISGEVKPPAREENDEHTISKPEFVPLLSSEEQFFDIMRMRNMEISTAKERTEGLARKLWSARHFRTHPVLNKLTSITIIQPLCMWYFQAICKRLVRPTPTEDEGEALLEQARKDRVEVDRMTRKAMAQFAKRDVFQSTPQAWQQVKMMSPKERAEKKSYLKTIKMMTAEAEMSLKRSREILDAAITTEKKAKMLLPRMQLSVYTVQNFELKLAAARHKENLLERMDINAIKKALSGGGAKNSELSDISMEIIRSSLAGKRPKTSDILTLNELVAQEMSRPTSHLKTSIMLPSPSTSIDHNRYNKGRISSDVSSSMEVVPARSFRKAISINPLNSLSRPAAAKMMHAVVGETRWARRKSKGKLKVVDKILQTSDSAFF